MIACFRDNHFRSDAKKGLPEEAGDFPLKHTDNINNILFVLFFRNDKCLSEIPLATRITYLCVSRLPSRGGLSSGVPRYFAIESLRCFFSLTFMLAMYIIFDAGQEKIRRWRAFYLTTIFTCAVLILNTAIYHSVGTSFIFLIITFLGDETHGVFFSF